MDITQEDVDYCEQCESNFVIGDECECYTSYSNGDASVEVTSSALTATEEYTYPSKRRALEKALERTLEDCLRMQREIAELKKDNKG